MEVSYLEVDFRYYNVVSRLCLIKWYVAFRTYHSTKTAQVSPHCLYETTKPQQERNMTCFDLCPPFPSTIRRIRITNQRGKVDL